jgi:hypothetical protein
MVNNQITTSCLRTEALSKRNNYTDSYEENLAYLCDRCPDKILFSLQEVANIIAMSYEFVRISVNNGLISAKAIGSRRLVHRGELARLITEGVTNNGRKKK